MDNHSKKKITKNKKYTIVCDKVMLSHKKRNNCTCPDVVLNLIDGDRIWTRVEFECGERIKINTSCLDI